MGFQFIRRRISPCVHSPVLVIKGRKTRISCRGIQCGAACNSSTKMRDYQVMRIPPKEPEQVEQVEQVG